MNPLLLQPISEIIKAVIGRVWPDPAEQAKAQLELAKMQMDGSLAQLTADTQLAVGQMDINKIEAANPNVFVSGPRPFIMWVCGVSLAYVGLVEPIMRFVATVMYQYKGTFPIIDTTLTLQLLFGLLGLGAMRSYDKKNGVAS